MFLHVLAEFLMFTYSNAFQVCVAGVRKDILQWSLFECLGAFMRLEGNYCSL